MSDFAKDFPQGYSNQRKHYTKGANHEQKFLKDFDYTVDWLLDNSTAFDDTDIFGQDSELNTDVFIDNPEREPDWSFYYGNKLEDYIRGRTESIVKTYMQFYSKSHKAGKIKIQRQYRLKNIDELDIHNLGLFWSFEHPERDLVTSRYMVLFHQRV